MEDHYYFYITVDGGEGKRIYQRVFTEVCQEEYPLQCRTLVGADDTQIRGDCDLSYGFAFVIDEYTLKDNTLRVVTTYSDGDTRHDIVFRCRIEDTCAVIDMETMSGEIPSLLRNGLYDP